VNYWYEAGYDIGAEYVNEKWFSEEADQAKKNPGHRPNPMFVTPINYVPQWIYKNFFWGSAGGFEVPALRTEEDLLGGFGFLSEDI